MTALPMPADDALAAALGYARRGWPVAPAHWPAGDRCSCGVADCSSIGKHPRTPRGLYNATTNLRQVKSWWAHAPEANILVRTGAVSGMIVLDIDTKHQGMENLMCLEREHCPLPETLSALTGGGGRHFIFAHPGDVIRNSVGELAPGVDTRGDGGYIIAPPSRHASGNRYRWLGDTAIASLPDAWIALLPRPKEHRPALIPSDPSEDDVAYWLDQALLQARLGSRNATGFWLACQLRDAGFDEAATCTHLEYYASRIGGNYTVKEALHSVAMCYQQPARERAKSRTPRPPLVVLTAGGRQVQSKTGAVLEESPAQTTEPAQTEQPKKPSRDLLDVARRWHRLHGDTWSFDAQTRVWHQWTGTHHASEERGSTTLDKLAMDVLRGLKLLTVSGSRVDAAIRAAATLSVRSLEPPASHVNFANGTLDTAGWQLMPHDREHGFTYCLHYPYERGPYPTISAFLAETIPDQAGVFAYMAHVGLALLGDLRLHKTLILLGPPRAGKSTLLALANAVCGHTPVSNAGPELFSRETEGLRSRASWNTRRIVTLEELPVEALRNEEIIKAMAAHGGVPMRQLWQAEALENRWKPKLIMATNERPRYSDRTGALTKRIIPISCPNGRADTALDPFLLDRLLPGLPGFAADCLDMATEVLQGGGVYPMSDAMRDLLAEIEQQGDALKAWVRDCCVLGADLWQPTNALYLDYRTYCEQNGNKCLGKERFAMALCERYADVHQSRHRVPGFDGAVRCLNGLQLLPKEVQNSAQF